MSLRIVALLRSTNAAPGGDGRAAVLGHCDDAALRAGLALRAAVGSRLTVISAGPPDREDGVLRQALAAGADQAVHISDASLEGVDYHGVARVLAAATRSLGFDLVLIGDRSTDEGQGAVGPAVAEALAVSHVTSAIDVRIEGQAALVTRRDAAALRTIKVGLPLIVTVLRSPAPPLRAGEATGAVERLDLGALGIVALELRHRVSCVGRASPVSTGSATMLGRPDELIARLRVDRLLVP